MRRNTNRLYHGYRSYFNKSNIFIFGLTLFFLSQPAVGQVKINEILVSDLTINYDNTFNYTSWVEIANLSYASVNIGGFYLSDDKNNLKKWVVPVNTNIPGQSYRLLWCNEGSSGLNANFSLNTKGAAIYLMNPSFQVVDSITYPEQYPDLSFGRVNNGLKWGYLLPPTPASANAGEAVFGRLSPPLFSLPSGRYSNAVTVTLNSQVAGATQINYTLDGSEPSLNSPVYAHPISVAKTTVIKAKLFHPGTIPSPTITNTYFINEHSVSLPVVSVSMNPAYLNDNTIGIYVTGSNGKKGNCSDEFPVNWNQDWERASVAQIFNKEGKELLNQGFDVSITGKCSRTASSKSLSFQARRKYEKGDIDLKIFQSKQIEKFDAFNLRNSGNDFWNTMLRDGLMQTLLIDKMDVDYQAFQPAVTYLNGQYWGILNMREKVDENYIKRNYNISSDSIDLLEGNGYPIEGSATKYQEFIDQIKIRDVSQPSTFDYINANIDVDEYIHYLIAQIYYGNTDWPGNNIKFWKQKRPGSKWRWIIYDTDFGFAIYSSSSTATHQTLHFVTDSTTTVSWPNPLWSTLLFRRCIKNPTFRERFVQSFNIALTSIFRPERVHHFIDSLSGNIASEMVYHKQRWGGSITDWNNEVQKLHNFADQRYSFFVPYFKNFFKLNATAKITAKPESEMKGKTFINQVHVVPSDTIDVLWNIPFEAYAKPADGYRFKKWNIKSSSTTREYSIIKGDNWKYNDKGVDLNTAWRSASYIDSDWSSGNAELGYGDGGEKTLLNFGTDPNNKYTTTYFRKNIAVPDAGNISSLKYSALIDDGCVIYINGNEVARLNMPVGSITYNTFATASSAEGVYENGYIDPVVLVNGNNTVAIEVHQNNGNSSDVSFDFELEITKNYGDTVYYSNTQWMKDTVLSDMDFVAEFEPVETINNLYINEISAKNSHIWDEYKEEGDWFELYNGNSDTIDLYNLTLTDDFSNPCKYRISAYNQNSLKIPPYGFYVFWADDDAFQGISHCPFKLFGKGEQIGIFQIVGADTICIDSITYGKQIKEMSYCRFPDGTGDLIFTNVLTPVAANKKSVIIPLGIEGPGEENICLFPNPADQRITVKIPGYSAQCVYEIFNVLGKLVDRGKMQQSGVIRCDQLQQGIYFLKIYQKDNVFISRFMVQHF